MHRVDTIVTDVRDKESEITNVKEALVMNGYPDWLINKVQVTDLTYITHLCLFLEYVQYVQLSIC